MNKIITLLLLTGLLSCQGRQTGNTTETMKESIGIIEKNADALDAVIDKDPVIDTLASGFEWSEGPLWLEKENMLIFSDVPANTIYKWTAEKGKEIYLKPSGYTGSTPSLCKEPGSNGLTLDREGRLILCQHGDRRMARMEAPLDQPSSRFFTLAEKYEGKKFSSPNDAVVNRKGELFFTDPPYGLQTQDDSDPKKELPFNGVYKVKKDGTVILLTAQITRPNGLAFFPGEQQLLVACSDPKLPHWYIYDVAGDSLRNGRIFYSAADARKGVSGLPDGLKINKDGIVFASGPGGIWIFDKAGTLLGKIRLQEAASNVALSSDEKILFITNDSKVLRVQLKK